MMLPGDEHDIDQGPPLMSEHFGSATVRNITAASSNRAQQPGGAVAELAACLERIEPGFQLAKPPADLEVAPNHPGLAHRMQLVVQGAAVAGQHHLARWRDLRITGSSPWSGSS